LKGGLVKSVRLSVRRKQDWATLNANRMNLLRVETPLDSEGSLYSRVRKPCKKGEVRKKNSRIEAVDRGCGE